MRRSCAALLVAAALLPAAAHADESGSASYFAEGQRLMKEEKYAEACPQFERALALNPGAGTRFNLAACYEKIGRPASALALYREVERVTRQVGQQDWSAAAQERASALEARVPKVIVRAPWATRSTRAVFLLDDRPLTLDELDRPLPVDLGRHAAVARFEAVERRAEVTIDAERDLRVLLLEAIPEADAAPAPRSAPAPVVEPPPPTTRSPRGPIGIGLAAAGVVAVAVGGVLALGARSTYADATRGCDRLCPQAEADEANAAGTQADVATVLMIAGGALAAGGLVLWLTAARDPSPRSAARPFQVRF